MLAWAYALHSCRQVGLEQDRAAGRVGMCAWVHRLRARALPLQGMQRGSQGRMCACGAVRCLGAMHLHDCLGVEQLRRSGRVAQRSAAASQQSCVEALVVRWVVSVSVHVAMAALPAGQHGMCLSGTHGALISLGCLGGSWCAFGYPAAMLCGCQICAIGCSSEILLTFDGGCGTQWRKWCGEAPLGPGWGRRRL
jgi:hypothetical protein